MWGLPTPHLSWQDPTLEPWVTMLWAAWDAGTGTPSHVPTTWLCPDPRGPGGLAVWFY